MIQDGMLGAHPAYRSVHLHPQHKQALSARHTLLLDSCLLIYALMQKQFLGTYVFIGAVRWRSRDGIIIG